MVSLALGRVCTGKGTGELEHPLAPRQPDCPMSLIQLVFFFSSASSSAHHFSAIPKFRRRDATANQRGAQCRILSAGPMKGILREKVIYFYRSRSSTPARVGLPCPSPLRLHEQTPAHKSETGGMKSGGGGAGSGSGAGAAGLRAAVAAAHSSVIAQIRRGTHPITLKP